MKNIITYSIITLLVCLLIACNKKNHIINITKPNNEYKGLAIIGNSTRSVNYFPKENFILLKIPDSGFWKKCIIKSSKKTLTKKLFDIDNDYRAYHLFDSLEFGTYQISYISTFCDTISETFDFKKSVELTFPNKLNQYYEIKKMTSFNLASIKTSDTLQIVQQRHGCFGLGEYLKEFQIRLDSSFIRSINLNPNKYSSKNWEYIKVDNTKKSIDAFFKRVDAVNPNSHCSTNNFYSLKLKSNNTVYQISDNHCSFFDYTVF